MTAAELERRPEFEHFIAAFGPHCGAPKSVFVGQLAASLTELLANERERIAKEGYRA